MAVSVVYLFIICLIIKEYHVFEYRQQGYVIKSHRIEINYVNPNFFRNFRFANTKHNRTIRTFSLHIELLQEINQSYTMTDQAYVFLNNEYKRFAPFRLSHPFCQVFEVNLLGIVDMYRANNIPPKCPLVKGKYVFKNMTVDSTKFIPLLPLGEYQLNAVMQYQSATVLNFSWFGGIENVRSIKHN